MRLEPPASYHFLVISEAPRLHHQLEPMIVDYQTGFSPEVLEWLESRGHATFNSGYFGSVVGAIGRTQEGSLVAVADSRKAGGVAGINISPSPSPPSTTTSSPSSSTPFSPHSPSSLLLIIISSVLRSTFYQ